MVKLNKKKIMKKYAITILVDEFYVADSLHEFATEVECGTNDVMDYAGHCGDHYEIVSMTETNV